MTRNKPVALTALGKSYRSRDARLESAWRTEGNQTSEYAATQLRIGNAGPVVSELRARGDDLLAETLEKLFRKLGGQIHMAVHHAAKIYETFKTFLPHEEALEASCLAAEREFEGEIDREAVRDALKNRAKKRAKRAAPCARV